MKRKWEGKAEKNSRIFPSKPDFTKYPKHNIFWEVFQPLFIVPKQTLMSFISTKGVKRKNYNSGDKSRRSVRTKWFSHTLRNFGTPCKILAYLAKTWHTLPNFGIPCQIDDFALRSALFSSILLLIALSTPFQVWQGVLKYSKPQILHVIDLQLALP